MTLDELVELWTATSPAINAYVRAEVRNRHDAEDVMQEIGKAVISAADRYDATRSFASWAFGIARHHILKYYERQSHQRTVFSSAVVDEMAEALSTLVQHMPARQEALQLCLAGLKPRQRRVVQLYYEQDLPQSQVAEALAMTTTAVGVLLHRTREALRECIHRRLAGESR